MSHDAGQRASVRALRENGEVVVIIQDTGRGIDAETLRRIFEPYYTTRPDGLGIGLAVAQRIVTAHEGSITITSEIGRGTQVRMAFPEPRIPGGELPPDAAPRAALTQAAS